MKVQNTESRIQNTEVGAIRRVARFRGLPIFGGTGILPVTGWKPVPPCDRPGQPRRLAPTRPFSPVMLSLSKHLLILCMVLIISACGGGGGGTSSSTSPSSTILFSGSTPVSNSVYMVYNSSLSSGNTLAIDVKANSISTGVYGAAFDVDFDSSKMTYSSYSNGSFLEQDGNTVNYLLSSSGGKVVVGVSRQGSVGGVSGSGTIVTLKFNATGSSSVSFSNNSLKDSNVQTISGITWYGGTVTIY